MTVSGQRLGWAPGGHIEGTDDTKKNPLNLTKRSVKPGGSSKQKQSATDHYRQRFVASTIAWLPSVNEARNAITP